MHACMARCVKPMGYIYTHTHTHTHSHTMYVILHNGCIECNMYGAMRRADGVHTHTHTNTHAHYVCYMI